MSANDDAGRPAPPLLQLVVSLVVLGAAVAIAAYLFATRERAVPTERDPLVPDVEVVRVSLGDVPVTIESSGRLEPALRVELSTEVAARVAAIGPNFEEGEIVEADELLFELDTTDIELARARATAALAEARAALELEQAQADTAVAEWRLVRTGEPGPLVRREPQLAQARARVETAEVAVRAAEVDLARTRVTAPVRARVERRSVDLGSRVVPGLSAGTLASLDDWRARLSISNADRPYLERTDGEPSGLVEFVLDGARLTARVARSAAGVDPRTQTLSVLAYLEPDAALDHRLVAGEFVRARVAGRPIPGAAVLPRAALRGDDRVLVVGGDSRVFLRDVRVARRGSETIVVTDGLAEGERVVVSPLPVAADGMRVRVMSDAEDADDAGSGGS